MISNENSFGWGAYQNKKKEVETLKKQLIVQDTNRFGEVITLNKYNDFQNVKTKENPFRFPNKIKNDEAQKNKCNGIMLIFDTHKNNLLHFYEGRGFMQDINLRRYEQHDVFYKII